MNQTMVAGLTVSLIVLALGGCCQTRDTHQPRGQTAPVASAPPPALQARPVPNAAQHSDGPIVGHLKTRDKLITMRSGSDGPLYTVKSEDGTVLAVDLAGEDLSAKFPELKNVVERGIADWAGMDLQHQTIEGTIDLAPTQTYESTTIIMEHNNDLQLTK